MYIIGGYAYSDQLNSTILTSCVFKYNFKSNIWSDLSESSKSTLPPIAIHRTVQVNDTLFILNGYSPDSTDTKYPQTYNSNDPIKENTINKMYKFDLLTEKWSVVNLKTNLDSAKYGDGSMRGASYNYYNGNIISYGALKYLDSKSREPYFGTLDLVTMEWHQNQIDTDTGLSNTLRLSFHQTLIIGDQLILFQSYTNQKYAVGPFVINLKDFKFQSYLNYSGHINSSEGPPVYTIIIIVLSSLVGVVLLISFIIFVIRYRKNKSKRRNNKQTKPVWAAPAKGSYRYLSGSEAFDHSQTGEIFSLENTGNLDYHIARSSFVQEDLNCLTLVRHGFDQNISSSNTTKIDP
ncbi:hypothetical protein CONCODRAFT_12357 [Conidiobolus coronatus NRRL 28638]|uniref:Galactose oxidase n=1 Tax=Conidiobolus coronatus (strain ATCC 28846 / CBS 209.66 / NRRL 28638) TaxID=796925 RepID=A0A137NT46_CONC2|nr:hypothetical protein CONCODRAFT_12357 [Conidiobolus coronatus NRRL 28638]|eukprot:KXN65933.1 hypothetical protein CONCODRAFT_12357 [Conidiobolus coronatus NRRL 28638]